jgi:phosphoribosylcarboxyaminoimidazole (NCAIR) mutase
MTLPDLGALLKFGTMNNVYSEAQMPAGWPVHKVAVDGATNARCLAVFQAADATILVKKSEG